MADNRTDNADRIEATHWVAFRTTVYDLGTSHFVGRTSRPERIFDTLAEAEEFAINFPDDAHDDDFRTWTFIEYAPIPF